MGRRRAARRLRHPRPPHRRPPGHHARGGAGGAARPLGGRLRRARSQPVRLLHTGHRAAAGRARRDRDGAVADAAGDVEAALRAHLCRCTGWQSIVEAACSALGCRRRTAARPPAIPAIRCWPPGAPRSRGRPFRRSGPDVVLGGGGFADDSAPPMRTGPTGGGRDACPRPARRPVPPAGACRAATARCPCRTRSRCPEGEWALTLQTSWLEPAYVEPDASWARPGHLPASPLANGGAFGGKRHSPVPHWRPGARRRDRRRGPRAVAA